MKAILSLVPSVSGSIEYKGERIDRLKPHKIVEKGISIVPEDRRVFPEMSVEDNLQVSSQHKGEEREKNLNYVFEVFPVLKERKKQTGGTLSGGEQQMLAIGQALMTGPDLLMLDEPSSGLMPRLLPEVFGAVEQLNKDEGMTILLVEQNVKYGLGVAERGYLLENGRIVYDGTQEELRESQKVKEAYMGT